MTQGLIDIHIIATNDIHGALFPSENDAGIMKAATYVKMVRRASEHLLLIDNGNALSGSVSTYFFSHSKNNFRNPIITLMNKMNYDASGISPNEFRYGLSYFNKAQAMADFPFLSANILHSRTKEPYFNSPYIIKTFNGMKIGIIGITSRGLMAKETVERVGEFAVEETVRAAKRWIRHMHDKESPDFVIALYHGGLNELVRNTDYKELTSNEAEAIIQASEGIDVMITGHQKKTLNKMIDDTLFIQAGSNMSHLCHIQLQFKGRTNTFELVNSQSELIDMTAYQEDEQLKDEVYFEEKEFRQWLKSKAGVVNDDFRLEHYEDFLAPHPFKTLLHDLLKNCTAEITCCHIPHMKAQGLSGMVTQHDLYNSYISIDHPVQLLLTGKQIHRIMERSAAALYEENGIHIRQEMLDPTVITDWRGFDYSLDLDQPIGRRVKMTLEPAAEYIIGTTDYIYRQYSDLIADGQLLKVHDRHMIELLEERLKSTLYLA
ncbi:bifunctional metallophosphatase/5'-nucleotidase [Macrococcus equipercicus]|uniref:Bifunctional metallophosphatase/5'-nucleotidase n=1 Tax=Macrococcus equipercicus TaxID=69967 RepID=A0A9Q9BWA1_9STAP|nr:bifunctional UDP-sugar hydrolase/5'-nucleotidase [Macrococcus equipercicus]UTH14477.1 bifunctional metallophosphatase/5'-nucleotidase [Macrococcus equipercicus]